jgi:DNA replication initiation complex subunit (GINS family)
MITYNDLYEYLRKERYSEQLQALPRNFVQEIASYFNEKKAVVKDEDLFSDAAIKTKKQLENAVGLFRELVTRRKKKILSLAFVAAETGISKKDFENMLDFEKELFDGIIRGMEQAEKQLTGFMRGQEVKTEIGNKLILFKQDTSEFLGMNGEMFGPYKKGDVANLPQEIVDILVSGEKAEKVEGE